VLKFNFQKQILTLLAVKLDLFSKSENKVQGADEQQKKVCTMVTGIPTTHSMIHKPGGQRSNVNDSTSIISINL
jgi:hypothetical protein